MKYKWSLSSELCVKHGGLILIANMFCSKLQEGSMLRLVGRRLPSVYSFAWVGTATPSLHVVPNHLKRAYLR